jgi:hypothetical protein
VIQVEVENLPGECLAPPRMPTRGRTEKAQFRRPREGWISEVALEAGEESPGATAEQVKSGSDRCVGGTN